MDLYTKIHSNKKVKQENNNAIEIVIASGPEE